MHTLWNYLTSRRTVRALARVDDEKSARLRGEGLKSPSLRGANTVLGTV